jgi:glycosyltransferase involved in cell wall biosynthesis
MEKVRILFLPGVDADNTNAQSLNVREIVLRLGPDRFEITLWYEHEPDARLRDRPNIRLLKLPSHGKTRRILSEMLSGYHIIAYMDYSPASYLFLHLPGAVRTSVRTVYHAEAPVAQMQNPSRALRFLYDGTFPRCDVYTGITEFVARDIASHIDKKVSYILPVGVDAKTFTPPQERSSAAPVILFAGTLIARKGPQHLIDAALRFPGALFRLVGSGREGFAEVLRQKITELGVKNVTLEGPKSQSHLLQIMRESDVFILPSRLEGLPKVTLEAAAAGLPCVVFRDYETPSVIDGVTGFQVSTIEEMMSALEKLIADPPLRERMGAAARNHAEAFDWDLVSTKWESAYLEIATGRAR